MYMFIVILSLLSFLGVVGIVTYLVLGRRGPWEGSAGLSEEDAIVRAIGIRGIVNSEEDSSGYEERAKRKLTCAKNPSFALSPKLRGVSQNRQKAVEFVRITQEALKEVLAIIEQLVLDLRESLKHFEHLLPEIFYGSPKNIPTDLNLARRLLGELERREEYIKDQVKLESPDYEKIYATVTEEVFLSRDSVNTLISKKDREPIHWAKLSATVKDIIVRLEKLIEENRTQRRSQSGEWD